jgi:hypothetical protein
MISTLGSAMTRIGPLTLENASGSAVLNGLDKGKAGSNFLLSVQFDVVGQVGMRNRTGHVLDSITIRRGYSHLFLSRCHIGLVGHQSVFAVRKSEAGSNDARSILPAYRNRTP